MANVLQLGNPPVLALTGLTNNVTAAVETGATVTCQLYKQNTTTGAWSVAGSAVTLAHVAAGLYRGVGTAALVDDNFADGAPYREVFTAYVSAVLVLTETLTGFVLPRGGS